MTAGPAHTGAPGGSDPLRVALLPGDGIGPEVTAAAAEVLAATASLFGRELHLTEHPIGWAAFRSHGDPLPAETLAGCRSADAVFLGAVGDPAAEGAAREHRPEAGLLRLRSELGCFANLRPARLPDTLLDLSPLRPEIARGTDLLLVRELAGGLYYGTPRKSEGAGAERRAVDTLPYTAGEIRRIAEVAFRLAEGRSGRVLSIDKANVLDTSRLWRAVVTETARDFPGVTLSHMLVDRAAMELVLRPADFDVLLTENLFGDILSDEAAGVVGSLGLLGSASIGGAVDLYEPVHGSAPDLAGRGVANPVGAVLSMALLLRHTRGWEAEAAAIERAVDAALAAGVRTPDIAASGSAAATTAALTEEIVRHLSPAVLQEAF